MNTIIIRTIAITAVLKDILEMDIDGLILTTLSAIIAGIYVVSKHYNWEKNRYYKRSIDFAMIPIAIFTIAHVIINAL